MRKEHERRKRREHKPVKSAVCPYHSRPKSNCQCIRESVPMERPYLTCGKLLLIEIADYSTLAIQGVALQCGASFRDHTIEFVEVSKGPFVILLREFVGTECRRIDHSQFKRRKVLCQNGVAHARRWDVINGKKFRRKQSAFVLLRQALGLKLDDGCRTANLVRRYAVPQRNQNLTFARDVFADGFILPVALRALLSNRCFIGNQWTLEHLIGTL